VQHEAHTDQGSVLRPDQFALVADMDGGITLYVPNLPAGTAVPRSVQLLTAIAAKIDDEGWIDEMIRGLENYR
jgi:hypothetical protein